MTKSFAALALGVLVCVAGCAHLKASSPIWPTASVRTVVGVTGNACSRSRVTDVNHVINHLTLEDFRWLPVMGAIAVDLPTTLDVLRHEKARVLIISLVNPIAYPKEAYLSDRGNGGSRLIVSASQDNVGKTVEIMRLGSRARGRELFYPYMLNDQPFAISRQDC